MKRGCFALWDAPRQHDRCAPAVPAIPCTQRLGGRQCVFVFAARPSAASSARGSFAGRRRCADLLHRPRRRAGAASRSSGARREAEAQTSRGSARSRRAWRRGAANPANPLATQTTALNQGLNTIYAPTGTAPTTISHNAIEAPPQGATPRSRRSRSGFRELPSILRRREFPRPQRARQCADPHQRHQRRDGVNCFGTFLDTALIGNISLITGACRRSSACAPPAFSISGRAATPSTIPETPALRREPGYVHAEHRIRRHRRTDEILHQRTFLPEQYRAGKYDAELECDLRSYHAGAGLRLCRPCSIPTRGPLS